MSTATKTRLADAEWAALEFRALFPDHSYEKWEVAGSVRRRRPEVADVEHVVIAGWADLPGPDLFATPTRTNLLLRRLDELWHAGRISQHVYPNGTVRWGERYRGVLYDGRLHEVFVADADNWGHILGVRTGPSHFSMRLVLALRHNNCRAFEGYVWSCRPCPNGPACTDACRECQGTGLAKVDRVSVGSEEAYFERCGLRWIEPERRA